MVIISIVIVVVIVVIIIITIIIAISTTTNIINGGLECGFATPAAVEDRVGFFDRYATILGTTVGDNIYCDQMASY